MKEDGDGCGIFEREQYNAPFPETPNPKSPVIESSSP